MADDPPHRELPKPRYELLIDALDAQCEQWTVEAEAAQAHGRKQQRTGLNGDHLVLEAKIRLGCANRIRLILERFRKIYGAGNG